MIKYMLDASLAIYVIKNKPIQMLDRFNRYADQMCLSMITVSELLHGAEKSQFPEKTLRQVEDFISRLAVLDYDYTAASQYGDIRANLERKGMPIGVNDLYIAAHARSRGFVLVTNNLREFERVEGLRLENWV